MTGKFDEVISDIMNSALRMVLRWCSSQGLTINPSKTIIVPFTTRRQLRLGAVSVDNTIVPYSNEVKYLGVTLDRNLCWNTHIDNTVAKATRAIWAARSLVGKTWGLRPKMVLWIFEMLIRPVISYAAIVWWPKLLQKTATAKLCKVQRMACLLITGSMRTCPTMAMEAIIGLVPVDIFVRTSATLAARRLNIEPGVIGNRRAHTNILGSAVNGDLLGMPTDRVGTELRFGRRFEVVIPSRSEWEQGGPFVDHRCLRWYTDGSKMATGVGAGVFGPNVKLSEPMGMWTTVFQAEIQAINLCARLNLTRGHRGARFAIFSDSQAALQALSSWTFSSGIVMECYDTLQRLATGNRVTLYWIPGHEGHVGNEAADELARVASTLPMVGPEPYCGVNWSTVRALVARDEVPEARRRWDRARGLRQSKELINPFSYGSIMDFPRGDIRLLVGFLTGHFGLRYHLWRMGRVTSPVCRLCLEEDETAAHVLCECAAVCGIRRRIFYREILDPGDIRRSPPSSIIKFVRSVIDSLV